MTQLALGLDEPAPRGNGGPPLDDDWISLEEAQASETVSDRPSYLTRYCGPGAPKRRIVAEGGPGALGTWLLLECGHWRDLRDWETMPALGRRRPTHTGCGCCRMRIRPAATSVAEAERWAAIASDAP